MAKPIAYFGFSKQGNEIRFINNSLNSPEEQEWDFGDGNKSTEKNPIHIYAEQGFFSVKLVVRNEEGEDEMSYTIKVTDNNDSLNASIFELVDQYLPSSLRAEMTTTEKVSLIYKWQLYLQPLVWNPYEVDPMDTHNEDKWPGLVNALIAQLVSKDIIIQGANQFISTSSRSSESESDNEEETGPTPTQTGQQIKSIETGPAKTEWYENTSVGSTAESESLKNRSQALANATRSGGALDQLNMTICQLAARVGIWLPGCPPLDNSGRTIIITENKNGCGCVNKVETLPPSRGGAFNVNI